MNDATGPKYDLSKFMSPGAPLVEGGNALTEEQRKAAIEPPVTETPADPAASVPGETPIEAPTSAAAVVEPPVPGETSAAPVTPVSIEDVDEEDIKRGPDGRWAVSIVSDNGQVQTYYGKTQKEVIRQLLKAQKHATEKIAQQQRVIEARKEIIVEPEKLEPLQLLQPVSLTPDDRFQIAQDIQDPAKVTDAYKRLRAADPEEVERKNQQILAAEQDRSNAVTQAWILKSGFNASKRNIRELAAFFQEKGWRVSEKNLDAAVDYLIRTGDIINAFDDELPVAPPVASPSEVVAPAAAPAAAAPAASAPAPVPPASGLPAETERKLRPGSSSTGGTRADMVARPTTPVQAAPSTPKIVLTVEEYRRTPMSEVRRRYKQEPAYRAAVDELISTGKI